MVEMARLIIILGLVAGVLGGSLIVTALEDADYSVTLSRLLRASRYVTPIKIIINSPIPMCLIS